MATDGELLKYELPLDAVDKNYSVSTVLEGETFTFAVRWNGRAASWFFDLYDVNGEIIIAGVRIALGVLLGRRTTDPRMPNGSFIVSDLSNAGREAGIDDLGSRVKVFFYPAAQLASFEE
jgi:hypothetical protein